MTVTAHCISPDWQLQSYVLDTSRMTVAHTKENIAEELTTIMDKFKIKDKVFAIVTDNAANMVAAVNKLKPEHVSCFGHTLNLVVSDAIKKQREWKFYKRK